MAEPLADHIISHLDQAAEWYHRLILVVAPASTGKTAVLRSIHARTHAPLLDLNFELSRRLLDLTERQRALQLPRLLSVLVAQPLSYGVEPSPATRPAVEPGMASLNTTQAEVILLDNIEVLFDVSLRQDPLRLLLGLSRRKTIIATWSGTIEDGYLLYAAPDHLEYRRYPISDFLAVSPEPAS
ncbi:MAG: BREX-3 system P-loop-containing protein BrxF [Candidatus Competibacteraceae bacterium]